MVSRNQIGTLALVDTFNQEKALVEAVSVIVNNLREGSFEALVGTDLV